MTTKDPAVTIIGVNPDTILAGAPKEALSRADLVFTSRRLHKRLAEQHPQADWHCWQNPMHKSIDRIAEAGRAQNRIVVLASGDPMFHGIGSTIVQQLTEFDVKVYPAPSCASLAAAALGWPLDHCTVVNLHSGADDGLERALAGSSRHFFCLTKGRRGPVWIAGKLVALGLDDSSVTVLENLADHNQRIRAFTAAGLLEQQPEFGSLNLVALRRDSASTPGCFLTDESLKHDGQITKFACRAVTLAALNPAPGQLLWDIGAGCGSVALGWVRLGGRAIAIEKDPDRAEILRQNARRMNLSLTVWTGEAAQALGALVDHTPDAVFFGGGLTLMAEVVDRLPSGTRVVANAVTLAGAGLLIDLHRRQGGHLRRIAIAEESPIADHPALKPARDVLQYCRVKP